MSKNIKEIGKELLGKSLNSFHRKTGLPQLERNNKMQDGILDGILSQVDNAYIEKTEQSNVIYLDGSGDGVVVLDSIEGNTMVNCIKTLTGVNINSENISSTLNGRVLTYKAINGYEGNIHFSNIMRIYLHHSLKENTTYTLVVNVNDSCNVRFVSYDGTQSSTMISLIKGLNKKTFTANTLVNTDFHFRIESNPNNCREFIYSDFIILEGDYSNKEINYFEGLQSSFEEKVNGEGKYEIEILMNNKNLINPSTITNGSYTSSTGEENNWLPYLKTDFIKIKPNTVYTSNTPYYNGVKINGTDVRYGFYDANKNLLSIKQNYAITTPSNACFLKVSHRTNLVDSEKIDPKLVSNWCLSVGELNTEFITQKQNKIKLLINEPLRGTNVSKDMLCIKDGKLVIERRYKQIVLNGNVTEKWQIWKDNSKTYRWNSIKDIECNRHIGDVVCDKIPRGEYHQWWNGNLALGIDYGDPNGRTDISSIYICQPNLDENVASLRQWLSENNLQVVLPLKEPIYEEVTNEYGEPIILEGYENGTLYIDSTIVPTTTVKYTPKMESFNTLKEVYNNNVMLTSDVNDNIIPYMMEVDLMIMEKEMALPSQINIRKMEVLDMTSMQKRTQDMLERLIKGKSLTEQECKTRITTYLNAGKITDEQAEELMLLIDEVYA